MPDLFDAMMTIWSVSDVYAVILMVFILIVSFTVMNMLVGILVGVVNTVSQVEKEGLMVNFVKTNLFELIDKDHSGKINRQEFDELLQIPQAIRSFDSMGVDVVALVDLADFIFREDHPNLEVGEFFDIVMQLRGDNQATVKDIVDLRKCVTVGLGQLHEDLEDAMRRRMSSLQASLNATNKAAARPAFVANSGAEAKGLERI